MSRKFLSLVLAVLFFLQSSAFAASISKEEKEIGDSSAKIAPPVTTVVSATRRETALEKVTRSVTVITREEIERSGKVYLLDLLRGQPGLEISQLGPMGRQVDVSIRGMSKEATLVMIDNVQITNTNQNIAALQNITTADIERIEILRGPQSVLYGADAAAGVIHIITKADHKKGLHGNVRGEYGTYNSFYEEGEASAGFDKFSFSGAAGRLDTEGLAENDDYENTTYRAHAKAQVTENSDLDVAFHHYNSIVGIDDGLISGTFRTDPNRNTRSNQQVLNTRYTVGLFDWWQQHVQYSFFHDKNTAIDPRNADVFTGTDPESKLQLNSNRHTFEYQSEFHIADFDVITLGYEFEHSAVKSKSTSTYDQMNRNHGWFAQNELTLWDIWTTVVGTRFDQHETYGFQASPLVSTGLWIAKTGTKLKSSYGKGFRAPTFNQQFFPNFGNPDLKPETSWSWDAGFDQFYLKDKGTFTATYFDSRTRNLIANTSPIATNIGSAASRGVELENRYQILDGLYFNTNYTYTHAIDRNGGKRLLRQARHQGKFGLSYDFWRFHTSADWIWVGPREDSGAVRMNEYQRIDLNVAYDLTDFLQLYARVDNLTNDRYQEANGFNMPGAQIYGGVKGKI